MISCPQHLQAICRNLHRNVYFPSLGRQTQGSEIGRDLGGYLPFTYINQESIKELFDESLLADVKNNPAKYRKYIFADFERRFSCPILYIETEYTRTFGLQLEKSVSLEYINEIRFSGVSGIGKTCTALHFVIDKIYTLGKNYVYVDINYLLFCEKIKKQDRLTEFYNGLNNPSVLILDHSTQLQVDVELEVIRRVGAQKTLIIHTGQTARMYNWNLSWHEKYSLTEEEFSSMWEGGIALSREELEKSHYYCEKLYDHALGCCKEAYHQYKGRYILTPGLVQFVVSNLLDSRYNNVGTAEIKYLTEYLKDQVDKFPSLKGNDQTKETKELVIHSSMIAEVVQKEGIIPLETFGSMRCPVNIFTFEIREATKNDCEKDPAFIMHNITEGEQYVKLSFIQPRLKDSWLKKLKLTPEHVVNVDPEILASFLPILDKRIGESLVESQSRTRCYFVPYLCNAVPTSYKKTNKNMVINEVHVTVMPLKGVVYEKPTSEDLKCLVSDEDLQAGHMKNVASCTRYLVTQIFEDRSHPRLIYPQINKFPGFDYYLYVPSEYLNDADLHDGASNSKKMRPNDILLLYQVTITNSHGTNALAEALDCVKEIIKSENDRNGESLAVSVYVVFLTIHNEHNPYTLRDCIQFKGALHINIAKNCLLPSMNTECRNFVEAVMNKI